MFLVISWKWKHFGATRYQGINPGGGGGVTSQTEVVPMLVRAPQNWTLGLNGVILVSKSTPNGLNGVGQLKSKNFSQNVEG